MTKKLQSQADFHGAWNKGVRRTELTFGHLKRGVEASESFSSLWHQQADVGHADMFTGAADAATELRARALQDGGQVGSWAKTEHHHHHPSINRDGFKHNTKQRTLACYQFKPPAGEVGRQVNICSF